MAEVSNTDVNVYKNNPCEHKPQASGCSKDRLCKNMNYVLWFYGFYVFLLFRQCPFIYIFFSRHICIYICFYFRSMYLLRLWRTTPLYCFKLTAAGCSTIAQAKCVFILFYSDSKFSTFATSATSFVRSVPGTQMFTLCTLSTPCSYMLTSGKHVI